jgi:hypothetical protein
MSDIILSFNDGGNIIESKLLGFVGLPTLFHPPAEDTCTINLPTEYYDLMLNRNIEKGY